MDFLGHKAKRDLQVTQTALAKTQAAYIALNERLNESEKFRYAALHVLRLRDKEIAMLKQELANLKPKRDFSPYRLHMTEDEEDALFLADTEQISQEELRDILRELEFMNADIEVDDMYDRSSLT